MQDIKQFIEAFIEAELETKKLSFLPDIDKFNKSLEHMDSFLSEDLKSRLGLMKQTKPKDNEFYEKAKAAKPVTPRHLFRIDKIGGAFDCYAIYVSNVKMSKWIQTCFLIKEYNGQLLIFSMFTFGHGHPEKAKKHWYNSGGEDIKYKDLKPIVETLRITAPEDDEESMKMYLK